MEKLAIKSAMKSSLPMDMESCLYFSDSERLQLPLDVEMMILEMLDGNFQAIVRLRRLCKRWKHLVDSNAVIWKTLQMPLPKRHPNEAEKWYRKAAQFGNQNAFVLLSLLYAYGYRCCCHLVPSMTQMGQVSSRLIRNESRLLI